MDGKVFSYCSETFFINLLSRDQTACSLFHFSKEIESSIKSFYWANKNVNSHRPHTLINYWNYFSMLVSHWQLINRFLAKCFLRLLLDFRCKNLCNDLYVEGEEEDRRSRKEIENEREKTLQCFFRHCCAAQLSQRAVFFVLHWVLSRRDIKHQVNRHSVSFLIFKILLCEETHVSTADCECFKDTTEWAEWSEIKLRTYLKVEILIPSWRLFDVSKIIVDNPPSAAS